MRFENLFAVFPGDAAVPDPFRIDDDGDRFFAAIETAGAVDTDAFGSPPRPTSFFRVWRTAGPFREEQQPSAWPLARTFSQTKT